MNLVRDAEAVDRRVADICGDDRRQFTDDAIDGHVGERFSVLAPTADKYPNQAAT